MNSFAHQLLFAICTLCLVLCLHIAESSSDVDHDGVHSIAELSENCTDFETPVLNCTNSDPPVFAVSYPDGEIECGFAMTLEQSAKEPTLSLLDTSSDATDSFYTILLVDTANSDFHPILHFGASNIPGSDLTNGNQLVLADTNPFSAYRGPSPPAFVPGVQSRVANYEWIVARQDAFVAPSELPQVNQNILFQFNDYLAAVNSTILSSFYFSSGFCVREIIDAHNHDHESGDHGSDDHDESAGVVHMFNVGFVLALAHTAFVAMIH